MTAQEINRSDLIQEICTQCDYIDDAQVADAVCELINLMADTIAKDGRVEVRGFGSFCLHHRTPRTARNPRTGEKVEVSAKAVPHFKPGKALKSAVDNIND